MVDMGGITRVICLPLRSLPDAMHAGTGFPASWDAAMSNGDFAMPNSAGGPTGDLRLIPDLDALVTLATAPGWAWAPADQYTQERTVHPACQRSYLRRIVEQLETAGLRAQIGFEFEWFTATEVDGATVVPLHDGPSFSANAWVRSLVLLDALTSALDAQGMPVERYHPEVSPGQIEVSLCPAEPMRAADWHVLFRMTVRAICERLGYRASFAPIAWEAGLGNGCHMHLSLRDAGGRNVFQGGQGPGGMTATAEGFTAGVLAELPALTGVACATPLSYRRLEPGKWAGACGAWGHENREVALRFVQGMVGLRDRKSNLELRAVDAGANPYLVIASVLAAGLAGVKREATLPPPLQADPRVLGEKELNELGASWLPQNLETAAASLRESEVLRSAMGDQLHDTVVGVRMAEAEADEGRPVGELISEQRWRF